MTDPYPHLLAPGRIGPLTVRNRIVLTPMGDRLAHDDGTVSDRQAAYLEARARGGAGLLVVGSASVTYPSGSYAPCQTALSHDRFVGGLAALAERVHAHGAALAAQLVHDGPNSLFDIAQGRPLLVPSIPPRLVPDARSAMITADELTAMTQPFVGPTSRLEYRVADEDDLASVIDAFAQAARRAAEAGFDGVEIHGGHGYLIDSFLSAATNQRDDRWGGSRANRARLLVEVLRAVRAEVGDALAVWCRLNAVERFRAGGETPDDLDEVAALAVAAGAQALHISAATDPGAGLGVTEAHTPHQPGLLVEFATRVKAQVEVPVIAVGRIEPEAAEQLLAEGGADFVAMGRKLLADPDLPAKLATGRADQIRPCIYQYRCIGNIFLNRPVACVANAATAHGDEAELAPTARPRRVLVAGGGPAGLEVAHLLAGRGHQVVLAERSTELGGALRLAGRTDPVLDQFLTWLLGQVDRAGVDLALGTEVTADLVAALGVSDVVVATGGRWVIPEVDGADPHRVRTPATLVDPADGLDQLAGPVVVLGGSKAALSLAGACAARGLATTVLHDGSVFAEQLGPPGRFRLVYETEEQGVALVGGAQVTSVAGAQVRWHDPAGQEHETAAATVISALQGLGVEPPHLGAGAGVAVHHVGDVQALAGLEGAMADARRVARHLD